MNEHSPCSRRQDAPEIATASKVDSSKTARLAGLIARGSYRPIRRLLVVGCGSGQEAAILCRELGCSVVGIDVIDRFDPAAAKVTALELGDATALRFPDDSFDFVYSYHALEHIPNFRKALAEMHRVLSSGGGYCVGTPNRARLIGYLGSDNVSLGNKLRWNLADWRARLSGRFRNEFGAHAGFTASELRAELRAAFGDVQDISLAYYTAVYSRHSAAVRRLGASGLGDYLFPSVYFTGVKRLGESR